MRVLVVYGVPTAALIALWQMAQPLSANRGLAIGAVVGAMVWMFVAARLVK